MGTLAPPMTIYDIVICIYMSYIYAFQCIGQRYCASQDRCEGGSACLLVKELCHNVQQLAPQRELVFKQLDSSQSQLERGKLN